MVDYLIWPWLERVQLLKERFDLTMDSFQSLCSWCVAMQNDKAVKECAYPPEWYKEFLPGYYAGKAETQLIGVDIKA